MDSWKDKENFTSPLETTIWDSSDLIRRRAGESIIGLERRVTYMRGSLRLVSVTEEELFGGVMEVGMRDSLEMVCRVVGEFCIVREGIANMRVTGTTVCLMVRVFSISRMDSDMRALLNRISSMETEYFTRMIRLYMECGRIMSYLLLTW
jgi:hypothetical protein